MSKKQKQIFTNSRGATVKIQTVNPWLMAELERTNAQAYGKPAPLPPTYEVTLLGGAKETHAHDETTLATDDDRSSWAVYVAQKAQWDGFIGERMARMILSEGLVIDAIPSAWEKRMKFLGIPVPADDDEKKLLYAKSEIVPTSGDMVALMSAIMALSGVSAEALTTAEATFRSAVETPNGDGA
jgi:hypothetical protein